MSEVKARLSRIAGDARGSGRVWPVVLGALLGLAAWPVRTIEPTAGLDPSWGAALHLAARQGLAFGSEALFTYGPLGFLAVPRLYFSATAGLSVIYIAAALVLCSISVVAMIPASMPRWLSIPTVVTVVFALNYLSPSRLSVALLLLWAVVALRGNAPAVFVRLFPWVAGAVGAMALLMKFNDGVTVLAISLIAVLGLGRPRALRPLAAYGLAATGSFALLWLALGQRMEDVPGFVLGSLEIARGYGESLGLEVPARAWEYGAAGFVSVAVAVAVAAATQSWPLRNRVLTWLIVAGVGWVAFKHGFVRHDGHSIGFFALAIVVLAPFAGLLDRRRFLALPVAFLALLLTANHGLLEFFNPIPRIGALVDQAVVMVSEDRRHAVMDSARARMRGEYKLDARTVELLRGRPVHIYPQEVGVIWAYYPQLNWHPAPVFQSYSAYTVALDDLNAAHLRSAGAPDFVLREAYEPIDARFVAFESPATMVALVCRYREVHTTARWQVLRREEDRCGEPRPLSVVETTVGSFVDVPAGASTDLIYARVLGVRDGPLEAARAVAYKLDPVFIEVLDRGSFRLVPGTASNPLIMAVPSSLGYSPPFGLPTQTKAFRVVYRGAETAPDRLEVQFFAISMGP